ncbi:hypothetical protein K461DRAFT_95869 [Myriangium duriaei CBS 260.36]|uniref:magnesium chelatase n=1 Tax=Myriangium duriaei CBS 260.36 TaxID=1168546 RepID=A0A9P4JB58_9PEZI|nr:hypothetical protein K461DRAFT_95869 [Myriangium duriaei CBS 260.36]
MHAHVLSRIQELGDLGLAPVLCLSAEQHGIVLAAADELEDVAREMAAICTEHLGLSTVVLECSQGTHLDHFRESLLIESYDDDDPPESRYRSALGQHHLTSRDLALDQRRVADVVIAKNLNRADYQVQIQALELIHRKRIYTRTAMHSTSKNFLLIALNEAGSELSMNSHLNDTFAISHYHVSSGYTSDAASFRSQSSGASFYSVLRSKEPISRSHSFNGERLGPEVISHLRQALSRITMTAEVSAYLQNVVVAMRLHRYVAGGISALATRHLRMIAKAMAVLHSLDFVTPAIVALAVRKVYYHRLKLADEHTERSLRWGGDPLAVQQEMQHVDVELAMDAVISTVQSPL